MRLVQKRRAVLKAPEATLRPRVIDAGTVGIEAGVDIGFLCVIIPRRHPKLVEVKPSRAEWDVPLWLVTHVGLNPTPNVRAFLSVLKKSARNCVAV